MLWFSPILWIFILMLLFKPHVAEGQTKTDIPGKVAMVPEDKLKAAEQATRLAQLDGLVLREQIAAQQLDKIRADQQALFAETCKAAGVDPDPKVCAIDLNSKTVTKRAEAVRATK